MRRNGTHWNDKIKLAMCELERKMRQESVPETEGGVWPDQKQVEAWTQERQRQRNSGQYCGGCTARDNCSTKEEYKRKTFIRNVCFQVAKSAAFALATVALIQGVVRVLPDTITVSSSVGGRELPIYCVETDKKQVALSFDAAWGNDWLMERDFRSN